MRDFKFTVRWPQPVFKHFLVNGKLIVFLTESAMGNKDQLGNTDFFFLSRVFLKILDLGDSTDNLNYLGSHNAANN